MKTPILSFVLFFGSFFGLQEQLQAQTTFTSKPGGGKWSDPNTWVVTNGTGGRTVPTNPTTTRTHDENNDVIVINSAVILNQNYSVAGRDGKLTITSNGSLVEDVPGRTLSFGSQAGADETRLITNGTLRVSSLSFYKADADINAPLQAACSITLANQSTLNIDSSVDIDGNLVLLQGNSYITTDADNTAQLSIDGCVMTQGNGKGLVRDLFDSGLRVCITGQSSDCGAVGISGLECNSYATAEITLNGCSTSSPLPVQLVSFTARSQGNRVQLNWATATELNAATFTVERSADGTSFQPVATVRAAGNSTTARSYQSADVSPRPGTTYYRLRQTDLDGTVAYSQVVPVEVKAGNVAQQVMTVYGNQSAVTVELETSGVCQAIRIMDSMGRVLRTEQMPAGLTGAFSWQVTLGRPVLGGVYIVQALTTQGAISRRVLLTE
ncbi:hypothetical protein MUN84_05120 [Hymenobacter sp. 5516J-16]|uniref:hypothetical protein n=1 Tax=Hymenobacter sp. 5516J-16 TaxID=2932253 RepID=UPI001FD16693|nr:hypothetical protein [Hymenobacter sp. 5516J-16]UOQ78006.1 hypothetical protein MUN84_05120 [Hymenobacter sp. 5516J-16]